MALNYGAGDPT